MDKKTKVVLGTAAGAGVIGMAAFAISRVAKAQAPSKKEEPKKEEPKKEEPRKRRRKKRTKAELPKTPPPSVKFPDPVAEAKWTAFVCQHRPTVYPKNAPPLHRWRGRSRKQKLSDWLTNVAYWEAYPDAPKKISRGDAKWAGVWLRMRKAVRSCLKARARPTPTVPRPKAPRRTAPPRPAPPLPGKDTPAPPPEPKPGTARADLRGAAEHRNAAIAVANGAYRDALAAQAAKARGDSVDPYEYKGARRQKLADWLANIAYWTTYPKGPYKLDPKDAAHKPYIAAWVRIRKDVGGMLALNKKLGAAKRNPVTGSDTGSPDSRNWRAWAFAMWATSPYRRVSDLVNMYRKAAGYLQDTAEGRSVVKRDVGTDVQTDTGTIRVTTSGLLAEAALRVPSGALTRTTHWRKNPSRAFFATTTIS